MPKKKSAELASLGRSIINARDKQITARRSKKSDKDDGQGTGYVGSTTKSTKVSKSIVEENDLDEFLAKADLAGTNFEAEHMNVKFISFDDNQLIESVATANMKEETIRAAQNRAKDRLRIPRRPEWTSEMSAHELQTIENRSFLEWRRELAELEKEEHILLTPFERNLEVWRQLWRVIERSDVVVQIVDARNPLLFRCRDLETYVKEVDEEKVNFILINKADLLSSRQRQEWATYFRSEGIFAAFWSAASADDESADQSTGESDSKDGDEEEGDGTIDEEEEITEEDAVEETKDEQHDHEIEDDSEGDWTDADTDDEEEDEVQPTTAPRIIDVPMDGKIVNRDELFDLLKSLRPNKIDEKLTIGMVGYPNVGKSSTINKLIGEKKVAVSATPGKTKHFQTLFIDDQLCLCDCPGLVMPSFVVSKEEMIASGILPCDEMRDWSPAVGLICSRVDRRVFERVYGMMIPKPGEFEPQDRKPTPRELLTAYAFLRGFMSSKGIPDASRAARIIIKDFVKGARLRYCHAPPGIDQASYDDFDNFNVKKVAASEEIVDGRSGGRSEVLAAMERRHLLDGKAKTSDVDRTFFADQPGVAHVKTGKKSTMEPAPGKKYHHNKNKKEKLRRVYGYLDA